jgi:hypothetical protein
MPRCIRVLLLAFFLAFVCEASVQIALLHFFSLSLAGYLAIFASLMTNPLVLVYAVRRRRWAYDLLKWIGAFSLVWTIFGGPYLHALGLCAITLIALCVWLRLGALFILRRKAAREWIEAIAISGHL